MKKKTTAAKKTLRGLVKPVYSTSIDEIASSRFNPFDTSLELAPRWTHRESKHEHIEHSTRIGPGVRARRVLWWSQSDVIQDELAAELHAFVPGRLVAWAV
ncbi:hypothetical protein [uncultured Variovorax sp.]|uniref:hypothetical protein n=1 Tax=uncultured Variovorax sp. TaxID=114708 RepID=UPI0026117880|nr:hypothetical protein [uncultured Variovorax sp.]